MIFPNSRYSTTYSVQRPDGSVVTALVIPLPGRAAVQGYYRRTGGQRLDNVANAFLKDATLTWQLCDANNSMSPDALGARALIGIPLAGS